MGIGDNRGKDNLTKIPITFFCIHGNHEMRPSKELGYQVKEYHGGEGMGSARVSKPRICH